MIGLTVFESDEFLDLPDFAKALYPYIILKADDNGLLNNMKAILRTFNSDERALAKLLETGFLLNLDNGIYAITHWEQQNHMPSSKFTPTVFTEEFKRLELLKNGTYQLRDSSMQTPCNLPPSTG
jgi:hypothetical protein